MEIMILKALAFTVVFFMGCLTGDVFSTPKKKKKRKAKKEKKNTVRCGSTDLYCFECEMEMSTKEKNGQLYCNNCGLRH
jgi:hypothetical protein